MRRDARFLILSTVLLLAPELAAQGGPAANARIYDAYAGNYRVTPDHMLGIDRFITDLGDTTLLFSDYQSGVVRRLFQVSDTDFVMGPAFGEQSPAELRVRFGKDAQGNVTGIALRPTGGTASFATRVPLREEGVVFTNGPVRLAGTLMMPAIKGLHPAIILLHGSGPLTRSSFGPYPHFFTSLGLAVLIYDKRGTGASTGTRLDASTGALTIPAYYPDDLANDALAAFRFLQGREGINPQQIGFWGSSEGGMLTTQVAARSNDVAFIINSSGFMGPLWQTLVYQVEALMSGRGESRSEIDSALAFTKLWMRVAQTGNDYQLFLKRRRQISQDKRPWLFWSSGDFTSVEQMRWGWTHVLRFSPLPALSRVACPVLGIFGELDQITDPFDATVNMREVLSQAGNKDFTLELIPNASHSLMETPSRKGMASGVFETLRSWLLERVQVVEPS